MVIVQIGENKTEGYSKFLDESIHESIQQEYHDTRVDTRYRNTYRASHLVKKLVHDNTHWEVKMKKKRKQSRPGLPNFFQFFVLFWLWSASVSWWHLPIHDTIFNLPSRYTIQGEYRYRRYRYEYRSVLGENMNWGRLDSYDNTVFATSKACLFGDSILLCRAVWSTLRLSHVSAYSCAMCALWNIVWWLHDVFVLQCHSVTLFVISQNQERLPPFNAWVLHS